MTPFLWCNRVVRLEGGVLLLSHAKDKTDWNFYPDKPDDDMAFAFDVNGRVYGALPLPDGRLEVRAVGGRFVLSSDRVTKMVLCAEPAVPPLPSAASGPEARR